MTTTTGSALTCSRPCISMASMFVPPTVIAEVGYMLDRLGSPAHEAAFLRSVAASDFEPIDLTVTDYARMSELVEQYDDLPLGTSGSCARSILTRLFSSPTPADPSCIGHLTTAASASHLGCLLSRRGASSVAPHPQTAF